MSAVTAAPYWLVTVGEPLPVGSGEADNLMRTGLLAQALAARGHRVVWWTSTFDHVRKRHHFSTDTVVRIAPEIELRLIHGPGYRTNVSPNRMVDHLVVARRWLQLAGREERPAAIACSMPTIELAAAAVRYGRRAGVPVVIDVRDLWPDAIVGAVPARVRKVAQVLLSPWRSMLRHALRSATVVTATSPAYLRWATAAGQRPPAVGDRVVPLGFEATPVEPERLADRAVALELEGLDTGKTLCWFVGTFGATYDLTTVIDAASLLSRQGLGSVQFVLSGDGQEAAALRQRARHLTNVVFTGWLDAAGLAYLAGVADIGLAAYAPGAPQGLPNKLFQYLHAGVPVLSSLGEEAADLLAKYACGVTYPAGNPEALAGLVADLAGDLPRAASMGVRARQLFEDQFDPGRIYDDLAEVLEGVASRGAQHV